MICDNIESRDGALYFAGQSVSALAESYGTPLYLMDEDKIRENCRIYTAAFKKYFKEGSYPIYASKANSFGHIYRVVAEEGMGTDLVSGGEIYCAKKAGVELGRAYFHGSNKTDAEIGYAMDCGVGFFVIDGEEEAAAIEAAAAERGMVQRALVRVTPGIDTHTYEAINTGKVDSKFGAAIETGQAEKLCAQVLAAEHIELVGFHCHVGSEVFEEDVFERSAEIMLGFCAQMKETLGYEARALDLGGGYGVRYVDSDPTIDIDAKIASVARTVRDCCERLGIAEPAIIMEPGRSIVADAGMTVYTVGAVKRIPKYKNYVSVDGGMMDNPRYALYEARYTCLPAEGMDRARGMRCDIVGRGCESGDIIQPDVMMPEDIKRGELLAVCTTGAYNYSMASHYNRVPKPPVVMLRAGENKLALRRETYADLCSCEVE